MNEKTWWHPEILSKNEGETSKIKDLDLLDPGVDFGSYKIMLQTGDIKLSQIDQHNNIDPGVRVKMVKNLLSKFLPNKILDIGCGLGFTTSELKNLFPNSEVLGIDISTDAIAYGRKQFTDCEFLAEAIDPKNTEKIYKADLICAFEFYPFSRTSNIEVHRSYILYLMGWLKDGGRLLIFQLWDKEDSLSVNYEELVAGFQQLKFTSYQIPYNKVTKIFKSRLLSLFITRLLIFFRLRQTKLPKAVIITKK